ncbi:LLM class flavin-dependent oxidoreductase [Jatrophihabitans sp.]|uniref:LLM class flavin-dependent oxidoreductase n=1 Tax=Jatrophihabitans sp. TaxID=1932789 RepID=UPI002B616550|nr:LLM class flavin-dependent oxidoreductase [Jatrophihabitans sp.]
MDLAANGIALYSTCRSSIGLREQSHLAKLVETARWAEDAGFRGALLYSDNTSMDAWTSAQAAIANTTTFVPLIAVQPIDMSPFACARKISSLAHLYGRRVDINFVSGGFSRDLTVQADELAHDARYARLIEYVTVIKKLMDGNVVSHAGQYYNFRRARLTAPVPADLQPVSYMSGSSAASVQAGEALGLSQLSFPVLPEDFVSPDVPKNKFGTGIGIGIIARDDSSEAWRIARKRFPADPDGAERMKLLLSASVSSWQPQLAAVPIPDEDEGQVYWLVPFRYHHTFTPYLVGSYDEVAQAVATYLSGGVRTFVLDLPQEPDDLQHARIAIERAAATLER